mgnify:FL=1
MKCFQCGKGKMSSHLADVEGEVRGEKFTARCQATVCSRCGFQILSDEESKAYTVTIADAYRRKHDLLTSEELRQSRSRLGMSQQGFADYLRAGVASVKRWEAGLIQDEAMDELVRLKSDLEAARRNVAEIEKRLGVEGKGQSVQEVVLRPLRRRIGVELETRGGVVER